MPQCSYGREKSLTQAPFSIALELPSGKQAHVLVNILTLDGSGLGSPCCAATEQQHHTQPPTLCQSKLRPQHSLVSFVHTDHVGTCRRPRHCIDGRTEREGKSKFTRKMISTTALSTGMKYYNTLIAN